MLKAFDTSGAIKDSGLCIMPLAQDLKYMTRMVSPMVRGNVYNGIGHFFLQVIHKVRNCGTLFDMSAIIGVLTFKNNLDYRNLLQQWKDYPILKASVFTGGLNPATEPQHRNNDMDDIALPLPECMWLRSTIIHPNCVMLSDSLSLTRAEFPLLDVINSMYGICTYDEDGPVIVGIRGNSPEFIRDEKLIRKYLPYCYSFCMRRISVSAKHLNSPHTTYTVDNRYIVPTGIPDRKQDILMMYMVREFKEILRSIILNDKNALKLFFPSKNKEEDVDGKENSADDTGTNN